MGGMGRRSGFSFKKFEPCLGDVGAVPESSFAKGLDMQMGIIEHITGIEWECLQKRPSSGDGEKGTQEPWGCQQSETGKAEPGSKW